MDRKSARSDGRLSRALRSLARQFPASNFGVYTDCRSLLWEDPLDTVRTQATILWLILLAKQASSNIKHSTTQTELRQHVWFYQSFTSWSRFKSRMLNVSTRERDEIAREQLHREQRSLSPSMERWLADTGPFCATVKPEEKEAMAPEGSREGPEQDTVDHSKS